MPPRGGQHFLSLVTHATRRFNPCPRVGGNPALGGLAERLQVSIHAPAWGATRGYTAPRTHQPVSIHAPAWGATAPAGAPGPTTKFQSMPPRGGQPRTPRRLAGGSFNPCPRVGGNGGGWEGRTSLSRFQSMPPRGGQRRDGPQSRAGACFNPCPRVGGNRRPRARPLHRGGFNPCPRVGGNAGGLGLALSDSVSIHAPAWGATAPPSAHVPQGLRETSARTLVSSQFRH